MSLTGNRTERHCARRKAFYDFSGWLNLVQRDRFAAGFLGVPNTEQPAHGHQLSALLIDGFREVQIFLRELSAHCVLEIGHRIGCPAVVLTTQTEGILTSHIQRAFKYRIVTKGIRVAADSLFRNAFKPHAFDCCVGAGEVLSHKVGG